MFSVIEFGCIQSKGWTEESKCIYNKDGNACRLANLIGVVGCIGATALLALEAFFQNISSIKVRRRAVAGDLGFSAAWAGLNLIVFMYLAVAWSKSEPPVFGEGINTARAAIIFALLSVPAWLGCAYFAWIRWQSGADMGQFAAGGFEGLDGQQPGAEYTAQPDQYGAGYEGQTGYQDGQYVQPAAGAAAGTNPFTSTYQAPAY